MSTTVVKICGVRTVSHARAAADAGADIVGLVFAESRRRVSRDEATAVTAAVYEKRPRFVGVFANERPEMIARMAGELRLDLVQLSGAEMPEECASLRVPYMKVIHVRPGMSADDVLRMAAQYPGAAAIVLDSVGVGRGASWGGTGVPFDHGVAATVVRQAGSPIMLAGGLLPETVAGIVQVVRPWAVDVSSGVETDGAKDEAKIKAFVSAAKLSAVG